MQILVENVSFDHEELSYIDGDSAEYLYGHVVEITYVAVLTEKNKVRGEIVIDKQDYDEMKLSDVEEEIEKALVFK